MKNKSLYPENWNDEIRPAILKRDNKTCQHCGIKHRSYILIDQNNKVIKIDKQECDELRAAGYRAYRVFLQVAHKDNIKSNCTPDNLISLCNRCHYLMDLPFKKFLRLASLAK